MIVHWFAAQGVQQADTLVSPEHGIMVTVGGLLSFLLDYLHSWARNRKRRETLETAVQKEVQRILNLRAAQDSRKETLLEVELRAITSNVKEVKDTQARQDAQIAGVNTQLEAMRFGIFRLVAALNPELVKDLQLGGPVA